MIQDGFRAHVIYYAWWVQLFVLKYQLDSNLRKPVKFVLTIAESTEALTVIDLTIKTHELIISNMDGVMK